MKVHHLNCGTMNPASARLINGTGSWFEPARMVCHCLLVESSDGLTLVDTGIGTHDIANPMQTLGRAFIAATGARLSERESAVAQVRALGFNVSDVRHIVVTHLDLDHAGGLADFPAAKVHVFQKEHAAAMARRTVIERERYRPHQWSHDVSWDIHEPDGDRWFGFQRVRAVGSNDDVLLIPLHGHTRGHCAVAVHDGKRWLLHCGDAYFHRGEIRPTNPHGPAALRLFQTAIATDRSAQRENQVRLRELAASHSDEVRIFSAHDPVEFDDFSPAH